jgi:hypothetical protein
VRARVARALDDRYLLIARAYREDAAAAAQVLSDARLPEQFKVELREGGLRPRIRAQLLAQARIVESELLSGPDGRDRLLDAAFLSRLLRHQLANIPPRVFRDPELVAGVARLFREAVLAQENAAVTARAEESLRTVHAALRAYESEFVVQIQQGRRVAFRQSVERAFQCMAWFALGAVLIAAFVPEVPPRRNEPAA